MTCDPWWPWRGLVWWLAHPRCWLRSIGISLLILLLAATAAGAVGYWLWPSDGIAGWGWWWHSGVALALALATGLAVWFTVLPLAMMLLLDDLAEAVRRAHGLPVAAPGFRIALTAAVTMFLRSLPHRLGWVTIGLTAGFLGPVGFVVAGLAAAAGTARDAMDTALATEDPHPAWRLVELRRHRLDLLAGAMAMLPLALVPVVGWLVVPPAMVCGAALRRIATGPLPAQRADRCDDSEPRPSSLAP